MKKNTLIITLFILSFLALVAISINPKSLIFREVKANDNLTEKLIKSEKVNSEKVKNIFQPVIEKLLKKGVDSAFIKKMISDENLQFDEKFIKINVTGFLKKADYSYVYDKKSVAKATTFLENNLQILEKAEKKYNVPKEVIVAILWTETRFGGYLGKNHLPSVFFSTALVNEPENLKINFEVVDSAENSEEKRIELKNKIKNRSEKKANWAINELVSMWKIGEKFGLDFAEIYGSWAGAFGISQFLPSSYLQYSVDGNDDGKADLFNSDDAIFSVANYLAKHKWNSASEKQQRKAVWSYNNSNDYVDAVLKLSELVR
jgi:membrane-bound lytic murein transglycosylase B